MASERVARAASRHVTALLLMFLFLTQYAAADGESNSKAVQHGHEHYYPDKNLHVYPTFHRSTPPALDEAEDPEATSEPHPADELLQSQDADGSQSYILGGY